MWGKWDCFLTNVLWKTKSNVYSHCRWHVCSGSSFSTYVLLLCLLSCSSLPAPITFAGRSVQLHARMLRESLLRTQVEERGERSACCCSVTPQLSPKSNLLFLLAPPRWTRRPRTRTTRTAAKTVRVARWQSACLCLICRTRILDSFCSRFCAQNISRLQRHRRDGDTWEGKLSPLNLLSSSSSTQQLATRSLAMRHQLPNQRTTCGRQASASHSTWKSKALEVTDTQLQVYIFKHQGDFLLYTYVHTAVKSLDTLVSS